MSLRPLFFCIVCLLLMMVEANAQSITINVPPAAYAATDTVCMGVPVTFTATVTGASSYSFKWMRNGTAVPGATGSTYTSSTLATGNVISCGLYDAAGTTLLATSDTIHMVIKHLPHLSIITGATQVCLGDTIHLADSAAGGAWSSSDAALATVDASGVVTALAATTAAPLRIFYSLTNSCGSDTARLRIRVVVPAGPLAAPVDICVDSIAVIRDTATGGMWTSSDTTIAAFLSGGPMLPVGLAQGRAPGTVTVIYHVTNACGTYVDSTHFTVINCDSLTTTGVIGQGLVNTGYSVYPNPGKGVFSLIVRSAQVQVSCTISNLLGERIKEFAIPANKETSIAIDVPGIYILTITAGDEHYTSKIVVTK